MSNKPGLVNQPIDPTHPSSQALRTALGRFSTGVTLATCVDAAGQRTGLTANSFSALSLKPALVLWSLRKASPSLAAFRGAPHFAINVLAEDQVDLSRRFASPVQDKFTHGEWRAGLHGLPVLAGCIAVFECIAHAMHDAGDHMLFIGQVLRVSEHAAPPLLFQGGHYRTMGRAL